MKLEIDQERCEGHGRCYSLAPELFDADDEGWAIVLVEDPDEAQIEKAHAAVAACPERAITFTPVAAGAE